MDWTGGYSASWSVAVVDQATWADSGQLEGVREVSVSRDGTDDVPLVETGTMKLDANSFDWAWCRIYMTAFQGGAEKVPMATLLFERQSATHDKGTTEISCRGRSVLQPAADRRMARGSFVAEGADGAAYAASLLRQCTPAPVEVAGSFTLVDDVVFDVGASYLDAVWQLLNAANWCIQVDGNGVVTVLPMPTEPALELSGANAGLLIPGVGDDSSLVDVPNRYYAVMDGEVAVATNEDPSSAASLQARGRWVDLVDESPVLVDGESLEHYAVRKLAEAETVTRKFSYEREFWPGVVPFSIVRASLPANGLEGDLRVMTQSLCCGRGVKVSETSGLEVRL